MNKFKIFVDNILIYGFGGVIGKLIPFIMLPVITRIMPDSSYYGLNDLSSAVSSFGQAIAVFGMYDAMFRLFFERDDESYQKQVCSTAFFITSVTTAAVFLTVVFLRRLLSIFIFGTSQYEYLILLAAFSILVGSTNSIVSAPTKIENKSAVFIAVNTISPVIAYTIAIPLLLTHHYSIALQVSSLAASVLIEFFFLYKNRKWFSLRYLKWDYVIPLLKIGAPLMPGFLIYWIYNSSDRLMLQYYLTASEVGIYAVGAKLGQVSNLICTAFTGGWLYFSYSTMKEERQVENNSMIFEYLGMISFSAFALVTSASYMIYKIIFTEEYLSGYKVAPYLFMAPLLQMLFQVANNQFLIEKKSWPGALILFLGAVMNLGINVWLIPMIGIEGAAIGTLCGYLTAAVICVVILLRKRKMILSRRFLFAVWMTLLYFTVWSACMYHYEFLSAAAGGLLLVIFYFLYRKDFFRGIWLMKGIFRSK